MKTKLGVLLLSSVGLVSCGQTGTADLPRGVEAPNPVIASIRPISRFACGTSPVPRSPSRAAANSAASGWRRRSTRAGRPRWPWRWTPWPSPARACARTPRRPWTGGRRRSKTRRRESSPVRYRVRAAPTDRIYWASAFVDAQGYAGSVTPGSHRLEVELHVLTVTGTDTDALYRMRATGTGHRTERPPAFPVVLGRRLPKAARRPWSPR